MKKLKLGTSFTIFILFFGLSTLDAIWRHHWLGAGFWLLTGIVFLLADKLPNAPEKNEG